MPRIPIILPRDVGVSGRGGGPEALPPGQAEALRALEDRTARIDRELAVAQSWRAAVDRLAKAEDAEDGPPPGFTRSFLDEADKERAALLKTVPADQQGDLEHDLLSLRSVFADRAAQVEASGLALRRRAGLYRALDEYRQGVTGDPGLYDEALLRLDGLSADLGLSEDRLKAMRHHVRDVLGNAAVDGLMADPDRTVRLLSDGLFDDALSEAAKARRLSEAQTAVARNTLLSREQAVSKLTAQARQGTAPDEAILAAERESVLAPAEAARLRDANAQAAERAASRDARIQRVTTLTEPLDPSDPEDRAGARDYWESVADVYLSDDPEEQRANELAFVERLGVLPDGLARKYQGALLSDDPTLAVSGARAIAALNELNPALVADLRPKRLRRAQAIAEFADFDLPPERIVDLAKRGIEKAEAQSTEIGGTGSQDLPNAAVASGHANPTDALTENDARPDTANVAALDTRDIGPASDDEQPADHGEVLGALPEAIAAVLDEEGLGGDTEAVAVLAQITETALAAGLPLSDETADRLLRLSEAGFAPGTNEVASQFGALLARLAPYLAKGKRLLDRLWRRLPQRKKDDDRPPAPEPPLPRLPLGRPDGSTENEAESEPSTSEDGDKPLPMRVPFGEEQIPQIGDEEIDAQLRGVPDAIQRGIDKYILGGQFQPGQFANASVSNEDAIKRMKNDGRLQPDQVAHPPYMDGVPTYQTTIAEEEVEFVRITGRPGKPEGFWLMPKDTFEKIIQHPEGVRALKRLYALPEINMATHMVPVRLPKGTKVRIGAANGSADWGPGGGVQIEILEPLDDDWFESPVLLK